MNENMGTEHQRNDTEERKLKCLEKKLSQYHSARHKPHMQWRGTDPGPPQWEAGD